jgi:hypothetical protein
MPESEFQQLIDLCRSTHTQLQGQAARSVDLSLVVRNRLFGWYIVEFEGGGADRAERYGKRLIDRLASELKAHGLKSTSPTNLRKCREFYRGSKIQQTLSVGSSDSTEIQQTASVESFRAMLSCRQVVHRLSAGAQLMTSPANTGAPANTGGAPERPIHRFKTGLNPRCGSVLAPVQGGRHA